LTDLVKNKVLGHNSFLPSWTTMIVRNFSKSVHACISHLSGLERVLNLYSPLMVLSTLQRVGIVTSDDIRVDHILREIEV